MRKIGCYWEDKLGDANAALKLLSMKVLSRNWKGSRNTHKMIPNATKMQVLSHKLLILVWNQCSCRVHSGFYRTVLPHSVQKLLLFWNRMLSYLLHLQRHKHTSVEELVRCILSFKMRQVLVELKEVSVATPRLFRLHMETRMGQWGIVHFWLLYRMPKTNITAEI